MWLDLYTLDRPGLEPVLDMRLGMYIYIYMDAILMRTRLALFEIWGMRLDFVLGRPGCFVVCLDGMRRVEMR